MKTRSLLISSAVLEAGAGLALMISPAWVGMILLGARFDTPADSIVGRVAGSALLALAVGCFGAREEQNSRAASAIVSAMLCYNVVTLVVLAYAAIGLRFSGLGLWPAIVLHLVMAIWCVGCLFRK
jgi:hypothetical protein